MRINPFVAMAIMALVRIMFRVIIMIRLRIFMTVIVVTIVIFMVFVCGMFLMVVMLIMISMIMLIRAPERQFEERVVFPEFELARPVQMQKLNRQAAFRQRMKRFFQHRRQLWANPKHHIGILQRTCLGGSQGITMRRNIRGQNLCWCANTLHDFRHKRLHRQDICYHVWGVCLGRYGEESRRKCGRYDSHYEALQIEICAGSNGNVILYQDIHFRTGALAMHTIGFGQHDHAACVGSGMKAAEETCEMQGLRLTKGRRRVLEILLQEHRAMGAYDILGLLSEEGFASQPPVVYRALDFLVANGFAHKIQKLNAYVACAHPGDDHTPVFLICRMCSTVAETAASLKTTLGEAAEKIGFTIESTIVEAEGICPSCKTQPEGTV